MNPMPELVALLTLGAVLLPAVLCAQQPERAERPARAPVAPEVAAVLDRMAARRGPQRPGDDTTIAFDGTFAVHFEGMPEPVATGPVRERFVGTKLVRCTTDLGKHGAMEKGLRDALCWELDPDLGAKVLRGRSADAARRYFALLRGDDPRSVYRRIERAADETIDGRTLTVLRLHPDEGEPDTWRVAADGTLVHADTALPAPESADAAFGMADLMPTRITFADWRQVEGGCFAARRELTMGKAKVVTKLATIAVGEKIPPATFAPPEAVTKIRLDDVGPATDASGKPTYQVIERAAQPVASIRVKVAPSAISSELGKLLPEIDAHLRAIGAAAAGPPFTRYHGFDEREVDLEAGFPVQRAIAPAGRIEPRELPGGKLLTAWHVGPYDKLAAAHAALRAHLDAKKLVARGAPWEVYWTDPGMVPDPAKWRTQLLAPIE